MRDEPRFAGAPPSPHASPPAGGHVTGSAPTTPGQVGAQTDRLLPAILLVLASVALFSVGDVLAKLLRQSLPAAEIAWLRYVAFAGLAPASAEPAAPMPVHTA